MAKLFVRPTLTDFYEAEPLQDGYDFLRLEYGILAHASSDLHGLNADKFCVNARLPILEQQLNNFPEVLIQLV